MEELFAFYTEQERQIREKLDFLSALEQTISLVKKRMKRQMEYPALGEVFVLDEEETRIIRTEAEGIGPENVLNASYSKLKNLSSQQMDLRTIATALLSLFSPTPALMK